jgi:hypothetical protein
MRRCADRPVIFVPAKKAFLVSLAVGALALAGCGGGGSSTGGSGGDPDTSAIELPTEIEGFKQLVAQIKAKHEESKVVTDQEKNVEATAKATADAYSEAYGGAAAAYASYADPALEKLPYVIAVRAESPGMTIGPVVDPKFLGLAKPEREVTTVGEVECQIIWSPPVTAGQTPDPSSELTTNCQRSGSGATVFVGASAFEGPSGLKEMAAFTEAAWQAVTEG